jgi:hypothetical protein
MSFIEARERASELDASDSLAPLRQLFDIQKARCISTAIRWDHLHSRLEMCCIGLLNLNGVNDSFVRGMKIG